MTTDATPPVDTGQGGADGNAAVDALNGSGNAGGGDTPWYGDLSSDPDLQGWVQNKNFDSPLTALKSQRELEKMIGNKADMMQPPAEDQDLSTWEGWDKLGVPKDKAAFEEAVKVPDLPEGMEIDKQLLDKAYEIAAQKRIPAQHMQEMVNLFAETQKAQFEAAMEADKSDRADLEKLYGQWGNTKSENLEYAKRAAKALGFEDDLIQEGSELMGSAKLIAKMAEAGKKMSEGGLLQMGGSVMTTDQAKQELAAMKADQGIVESLMDSSHPQHASNKQRWEKLSRLSMDSAA